MDKKLEQFMIRNLGVRASDVEKPDAIRLDKLYEKAPDLEVEKAIEADEKTELGITEESEAAAHVTDFIHEVIMKK